MDHDHNVSSHGTAISFDLSGQSHPSPGRNADEEDANITIARAILESGVLLTGSSRRVSQAVPGLPDLPPFDSNW